MKSFKSFVAEVAQPEAEEEKRFKAQHTVDKINHPHAEDGQFTGEIKGKSGKAKRIADQDGDANYDKAYKTDAEKRMVPESVEDEELLEYSNWTVKAGGKEKTFKARHAGEALRKANKSGHFGNIALDPNKHLRKEEVEEELSPKQKKIDHNKNGKIDGHDLAMLRAKKKNEEVVNETTMSATKKPVNVTGPDGKTRTVMRTTKVKNTDDYGQDKISTNEEAEQIDELSKKTLGNYITKASDQVHTKGRISGAHDHASASTSDRKLSKTHLDISDKTYDKARKRLKGISKAVKRLTKESVEDMQESVKFKKGPVRLNDGSQVMVSAQDASLLNQMFKDLSPRNQKEMSKVAMMDKAGWQEILGFAREAL